MNRPFLFPVVLFLLGICAAKVFAPAFPNVTLIFAGCGIALLLAVASIRHAGFFTAFVLLFFFILGAGRYMAAVHCSGKTVSGYIPSAGVKACIYGTVTESPELKKTLFYRHGDFPVSAEKILVEDREYAVNCGVLTRSGGDAELPDVGDKVIIEGRISVPRGVSNPCGFDYGAHLANMGIHAFMFSGKGDRTMVTGKSGALALRFKRGIYRLKGSCSAAFDKYLHGDTRAIVKPLILGTRSETTGGLNDLFIRTGTMHILAVSGLHVTFVAVTALGFLMFLRFNKKTAYFLTIFLICAYAVFTGSQPSALRAALMGGLMLAALASGRKTALMDTLVLSAFIITFFDPGQLFRPGFILSYAAVLSIIYVVPVTDSLFVRAERDRPIPLFSRISLYAAKSFSLSLGVWFGMMPVIAAYFRIITPSAIVANLIAVPLFYLVMLLGFLLMVSGPFSFLAPFSWCVSRVLDLLVLFYLAVLGKIASFPCAFLKVPSLMMPLFWAYYAFLAGTVILLVKNPRRKELIPVFMIFAAVLFVWSEVAKSPENGFRATFFDVGKADAAFIETPGGDILIDGGSDKSGDGGAGRNVIEPYLLEGGKRKIACAILSHAHEDHIGGLLYLVKFFKTGTVIDGVSSHERGLPAELYADLTGEIRKNKIEHFGVKRGDKVNWPGGSKLLVLNPSGERSGDENSDSLVFKLLTPSNGSILFCGDATAESMMGMLSFSEILKSDIIKIPHHGSGLGDMNVVAGFLGFVRPRYAVITARGRDEVNRELLAFLERLGAKVFITGETGAVIAEESSAGWRVRGFRDDPQTHTADRKQHTEEQ